MVLIATPFGPRWVPAYHPVAVYPVAPFYGYYW